MVFEKLFGKSDKQPAVPKAVPARVTIVEPDETYITVKLTPLNPDEYITTPTLHLTDPTASREDYRGLFDLYSACGVKAIPKDDIVSRELLLEHMRHRLVGQCLWVDGGKRS